MRGRLQPPKPKKPDDALDFSGLSEQLAALEADLEAVDAAPTAAQSQLQQQLAASLRRQLENWHALRDRELPPLNLRLNAAGEQPVTVPTLADLSPEPAEGGKDLP
jgi:hypothetical protein